MSRCAHCSQLKLRPFHLGPPAKKKQKTGVGGLGKDEDDQESDKKDQVSSTRDQLHLEFRKRKKYLEEMEDLLSEEDWLTDDDNEAAAPSESTHSVAELPATSGKREKVSSPSVREAPRPAASGKGEQVRFPSVREEVKLSPEAEEDIKTVYHAGDLGFGRDTSLQRIDGGRSSGHFGTGVYFFAGEKGRQRLKSHPQLSSRRIYKLQFEQMKEKNKIKELCKPKNKDHAAEIHETLKLVNGLVDLWEGARDSNDDPDDRKIADTNRKQLKKQKKQCVKLLTRIFDEELKERIDDTEGLESVQKDLTDFLNKTLSDINKDKIDINEKLDKIEDIDKRRDTVYYYDSLSTRVMKNFFRFDGVDVRHIDTFNVYERGTVIYREKIKA